ILLLPGDLYSSCRILLLPGDLYSSCTMGSYRRPRPRFMSSPVLSDLARFHASSPALQLSNASVWNSVQIAVIKVFQGGGLQTNELHSLNESIRWLQRTELGSFMPEYFQVKVTAEKKNSIRKQLSLSACLKQYEYLAILIYCKPALDQLLNKGLVHVLEKIQLHEYTDWLQALSEVWVAFFTEILPTLQAIFYPVQGQELTVRQMALLGFRNLVLLKLPLKNMLHTASYPPAIIQMLLILQGIHEPGGPSKEYYLLESLVDMVISPYLSNYLSVSQMDSFSECQLEQSKLVTIPHFGQPEITVTHFAQEPPLAPLVEHEGEAYLERTGGVRRHTVANVHSDIQLLSVMSRMHPGDASAVRATKAGKGGSPRPCCSEPVTILDTPTAPSGSLRHQSTAEMTCELTS
ncbi:hypothetical protein P4O66_015677, partial [Electrophorus voltai]